MPWSDCAEMHAYGTTPCVGSPSDCWSRSRKFESQFGHITVVEFDHEVISVIILPFPLIQEGRLSVSGESMCASTGYIRKTYLYNIDPLKPHLYIVKLGFTGVCVFLLVSAQNIDCGYSLEPPSAQNIDCGYSLEPPQWGGSNEYPQSMFWAEIWKISEFFIWKFSFFDGNIFSVFE